MDSSPLPDDVARSARSYLAALVASDEVSDAWHELLDDTGYWGERDRVGVLRLAHEIVLQHESVTGEAAALALREVSVTDPAEVATILDVDRGTADRLTQTVAESVSQASDTPPGDTATADADADAAPSSEAKGRFRAPRDQTPLTRAADTEPAESPARSPAAATVRVIVDDDEEAADDDEVAVDGETRSAHDDASQVDDDAWTPPSASRRPHLPRTPWLIAFGVVVWAAVLFVWLFWPWG